jgi:hypothetical protein
MFLFHLLTLPWNFCNQTNMIRHRFQTSVTFTLLYLISSQSRLVVTLAVWRWPIIMGCIPYCLSHFPRILRHLLLCLSISSLISCLKCAKVEAPICLKISNCSYKEIRFITDQKYMQNLKLKRNTKLIFLNFPCKK